MKQDFDVTAVICTLIHHGFPPVISMVGTWMLYSKKIYVSLLFYFKKELNILRVAINVLDIFQLSDVYQMKMYASS